MNWSVNTVVQATGGRLLCGPSNVQYHGIGIDSRTIEPDQLFVAICGERYDAHRFIAQVVEKGVRGVVVAAAQSLSADLDAAADQGVACIAVTDTTRALGALAAYQRRQAKIPVVAITGSNGKTTTRRMTALVLAQRYKTLATRGNFNNEVGLPLTLFNLSELHQAAVLELGMNHAGEIDRLAAICQPTIGVITNVGPAHLEFLKTVEGVARAKGELLSHIAVNGHAVLNRDDPHVAGLADASVCPVTFFGITADAHIRAASIGDTQTGVAFDLVLPTDRARIQIRSPGRFMVHNALAAAAAGYLAGLNIHDIKAGLESFQPQSGRLQILQIPTGVTIIDDTYNANPASMKAAIDTFRAHGGQGRGYVVLGDMLELGPKADAWHQSVGRYAARANPQRLLVCGDHAPSVVAGAQSEDMPVQRLAAGSKEEITADLIARLVPGDWILVKGSRGMAMETVVQAIKAWQPTTST